MLSFSQVAEALTGLIYHRPSGENSKFLPSLLFYLSNLVFKRKRNQKAREAKLIDKNLKTPVKPKSQNKSHAEKMKVFTPEISWHQKEPIFSVDFCSSTWRLATAGADFTVKVGLHRIFARPRVLD